MGSSGGSIGRLEVPISVRLGERSLRLREVLGLVPGSIIELPQRAEDELTLVVNNKALGLGQAVKVGENFGVRITFMGDVLERMEAMMTGSLQMGDGDEPEEDDDAAALAEAMLAGQL